MIRKLKYMVFIVQPSEPFKHTIKAMFYHNAIFSIKAWLVERKKMRVQIRLPRNTLHIHLILQNWEN